MSWSKCLGQPLALPVQGLPQGQVAVLLADGAQMDRLTARLGSLHQRIAHATVFRAPLGPEQADATPHVLAFERVGDAASAFAGLAAHARSHGALSLLVTPLPAEELATRLRRRLDAVLPDGLDCVNRYFDGRVAPHLHEALEAAQRAAFFSVSSQWWVVGHDLRWQNLPSEYAADDAFEGPLHVSEKQQALLIDGCYPYAVIEHFEQTSPELLEKLPLPGRYAYLSKALTAAQRFGIDGGASAVLFCTLALTRGENFHEQPDWHAALLEVKAGRQTLQQAVKARHD